MRVQPTGNPRVQRIGVSCEAKRVMGNPDPKHISTPTLSARNLTMGMGMRRFTRLTNAFSKKVEKSPCISMYYKSARTHMTLRVTPAMESGLTNHVWTIEEMLDKVGMK